jgi:hypothetical protein
MVNGLKCTDMTLCKLPDCDNQTKVTNVSEEEYEDEDKQDDEEDY